MLMQSRNPDGVEREALARRLGPDVRPKTLQIWFQNRSGSKFPNICVGSNETAGPKLVRRTARRIFQSLYMYAGGCRLWVDKTPLATPRIHTSILMRSERSCTTMIVSIPFYFSVFKLIHVQLNSYFCRLRSSPYPPGPVFSRLAPGYRLPIWDARSHSPQTRLFRCMKYIRLRPSD